MDDLISREAAIDELKTRRDSAKDWYDKASADGDEMIIARADSAMMSFIESILTVKKLPSVQPEPQWIPVSERLPEKETVLATVETKTFKHRYVCEAVWIPRWTWKADFDSWEDCSEYNEDEDEYYVLEGWYERVHNWDDYSYVGIEEDVIAWQPLPEPYRETEP